MLSSLHIRHYVLIDSLDIDFPPGLVIISGPTGAGKSILIGALGLLMGGRTEASVISAGADSCVVEGEFDAENSSVETVCRENDLDYNGGHITIRRVVSASGRSRAFVNDEPVALPVLDRLRRVLVDIHSQHDTLLLTDSRYQLGLLDAYAGNGELLGDCGSLFAERQRLDSEILKLSDSLSKTQEESDYNNALCDQLEKAHLSEGEIARLEDEQYMLSHAGQIKSLLSEVEVLLEGNGETPGINSSLLAAEKNMEKLAARMPSFSSLLERFRSARIEMKDIGDDVSATNAAQSCDPGRLQEVDDRLGELYALLKRHSCADEKELIAVRDSLKAIAGGSEAMSERLEALRSERGEVAARFDRICGKLHFKRVSAIPSFSAEVLQSLAFMELDKAAFEVDISDGEASRSGKDAVTFGFNAAGGHTVPIQKCASGGELSRMMLALKRLMGKCMSMPTMIFDEIDTGVSGSVAARMGSVICEMGKSSQVFAITHLPQVAAKGSAHYLVEKNLGDNCQTSSIRRLSQEERVMEVARMLSGTTLTPQAIENARTLLG